MSVLNKLTEGIVNRDMRKEGAALLSKWEKTGLLEGLTDDSKKNGMARLLENQAKELLREAASTMAGGDVQGFSAVAFPIVRRVFGGLIANDLVSVQPMSLPSGLIFFMDFTYATDKLGSAAAVAAMQSGTSLYGGGVVGSQITGGVNLSGVNAERGFYALNNGYASATGSSPSQVVTMFFGTASAASSENGPQTVPTSTTVTVAAGESLTQHDLDKAIRFDPDLSGSGVAIVQITGSSDLSQLNVDDLIALNLTGALDNGRLVRRLTQISTGSTNDNDPSSGNFSLTLVFQATNGAGNDADALFDELNVIAAGGLVLGFAIKDNFIAADAVGSVVGATEWALENNVNLPEINIKVDSYPP